LVLTAWPVLGFSDDCKSLHRLIRDGKIYQFEKYLGRFSQGPVSEMDRFIQFFRAESFFEDKMGRRTLTFSECLTAPDAQGNLIIHKLATLGWTNAVKNRQREKCYLNTLNKQG
jgi:hypothetical protein